jgi:flavin-binding protein dodecin
MTHVSKIIELVGSSDKGWTEAAQAALDEAKETHKDITGLEVNDITASVDPNKHGSDMAVNIQYITLDYLPNNKTD